MIDKRNISLVLSIAVGLISVGLYYALHIEYFRILAVLFFIVNTGAIALSSRTPSQKAKDTGLVLLFAGIVYGSSVLLWP
jgi:4-amino-4-deoxy-L-arabinose transferase-like glycosyltransferase